MIETAGALLIDPQGRVLFGLRAPWKAAWPDHWDAVGGRLEPGETSEQAMIREAQEEVGVTPTSFALVATVRDPSDGHACHLFGVTTWRGDPSIVCDELTELRWFSPDELEALPNLAGEGYPDLARRALAAADGGAITPAS